MAGSLALKLEDVSKTFGSRLVLDRVNLEVRPGEVLGFLGPNGAGKTTTIKIATGFLTRDGGRVTINGFDLDHQFEKALHTVGGIVENPEMYGDLTGRLNLRLYARLQGGVARERIDQVLELVGLTKRADEKVKRYSLGMKQRISLAQALLHRPRLLILDEPTNGLDPAGIREMRDILKRLAHEEGVGILVSSHQLAEMQLMCDRVAIISLGRVIGEFPVSQLTDDRLERRRRRYRFKADHYGRAAAWFGQTGLAGSLDEAGATIEVELNQEEAARLLRDFIKLPCDVYALEAVSPSLEEAFIDLTGGGHAIE